VNEEQKEASRQLEAKGYLPNLRAFAMSKCAQFFWSFHEAGKVEPTCHNGTLCLVRTGTRDIGITADHVYRRYLVHREAHPDIEVQFGGATVYPETRLIDRDEHLDLATFDVPEIFVVMTGSQYHTPKSWPPPPLQPNELVLYGGFPGALRAVRGGQVISPFESYTWLVTDVTAANIVMHVDFANLFSPGAEGKPLNKNPGGISGGPVFRVIENLSGPKKTVGLELTGVIWEFYEPWETVRARHIRHVLADGTLHKFFS